MFQWRSWLWSTIEYPWTSSLAQFLACFSLFMVFIMVMVMGMVMVMVMVMENHCYNF